ncbi:MAG: response regulator transcription factor [Chloroflexales bacterium]|nr:response regulator transcription factor [Chloroflexales bacterium]
MQHILVVDDDRLMRRSVSLLLEQEGYRVSVAASGEEALALIATDPPDLVLLDIGLPGIDGLEALRRLRQQRDLAVIFVTARRREIDTVVGLELGADSYLTKPFNPDVLLAHVRAVLRRSTRAAPPAPARPAPLTVGDLTIDPGAHVAAAGGRPLSLSAREFALLYALAEEAGQVVSIEELIARAWGDAFMGEAQTVYVHIRWLREKLEDDPQRPTRILTVRGVGYKLVPQPADPGAIPPGQP